MIFFSFFLRELKVRQLENFARFVVKRETNPKEMRSEFEYKCRFEFGISVNFL